MTAATTLTVPVGLAYGGWIVVGVFVLVLVGVIIGWYTYTGSNIWPHTAKSELSPPGSQGPSSASGAAGSPDERDPREGSDGGPFSARGAK